MDSYFRLTATQTNFGKKGGPAMVQVVYIGPIIAIIAGILILAIPRLLNYVVAIYLIIIGILGLMPH
jgi:hypothetical protein